MKAEQLAIYPDMIMNYEKLQVLQKKYKSREKGKEGGKNDL